MQLAGKYPNVTAWLAEQNMAVSAIVVLEVLGYHKLQAGENAEGAAADGQTVARSVRG